MSSIKLPALPVRQHGTTMYVVAVSLSDLVKTKRVVEPYLSSLNDEYQRGKITHDEYLRKVGYQRLRDSNRVNRFENYIVGEDAICPTAILINDRTGVCRYDAKTGTVAISTDLPMFIVDGQHRDGGFESALESHPEMSDFQVILVIMKTPDKFKEMIQFETINRTAKGVPTELTTAILTILDPKGHDDSLSDAQIAKIVCSHAMNIIASEPESPWKGLIRRVDEKAKEREEDSVAEGRATIGGSNFASSLRPIYNYLNAISWSVCIGWDDIDARDAEAKGRLVARVAMEFWKAVKGLLPELFAAPKEYMLCSTAGSGALHLFVQARMGDLYKARRPWEEAEFRQLVEVCPWFVEASLWRKEVTKNKQVIQEGGTAAQIAQGTGGSGMAKLYNHIEKDFKQSLKLSGATV